MLNQSKCVSISGIDDVKSFKEMASAFDLLSVSSEEQKQLFGLLSGLLVLGNVTFVDEDDKAQIADEKWLDATEALLGVTGMATGLTTKKMTRGGAKRSSVYMIDYTKAQAEMARDALVKSIYVHLFDWVVSKVNAHIAGTERASELPYVGLLDIFGFENFKHNSFEQLCINFANEKLQQFFLTCV